ncbi:MAG: tetratricopeptide repeat protein [Terriglobales bacterium]
MSRSPYITFAILLLSLCALAQDKQGSDQQLPDAPQPQAQPAPPPPPPQQEQPPEQKPASGPKKVLRRAKPNCIQIFGREDCRGQSEQEKESEAKQAEQERRQIPANQPAPRSSQESSSKDQPGLGPMPGASSDYGHQAKPYDPHRADKDVEVGDFYFKRENYRAAESRYAGALEWMPNNAIAFFKLAQAQEKLGKTDQARGNYQQYLKILPSGERSAEARQALARLNGSARETPPTSPPAQNRQ